MIECYCVHTRSGIGGVHTVLCYSYSLSRRSQLSQIEQRVVETYHNV